MLKNDLLHSFLLVAKHGGISKAAEVKSLTVMAMSKQMSNLETQLGQPLFERSGRKLYLSEFGKAFEDEAKKVIAAHHEMDNWLASAANRIQGTIKVVAHNNEFMQGTVLPWLSEFCVKYPELKLELDIKETVLDINEDDYDIFWGVSGYLGDKFPSLKRRALFHTTLALYASPQYLQEHGVPVQLDDLEQHYVVGYLHNQPSNVLMLHDQKPVYKLLKQKVATVVGLIDLAISGLGIINASSDSEEITAAISNNQLQPIMEDYWVKGVGVYAYYHNVRHPQPKVKAFLDFFLAKQLQWKL
ncbi:LysR family transcriptional regulator [Pseudoalteromonas sp. T1lg65]|uniref:LysR family transcriptional regulator n=1 Tax=Pseudoalteromonas sp. T1lg65 TaxID=2077101 RepID=UPI003F7B2435